MAKRSLHTLISFVRQAGPPPDCADDYLLRCFVERRDSVAFASLVRRHGPMVLGVCRRLLHNHHDAEDAFQATFLALATQADRIGRTGALAGWLYRVAFRTARKAQCARRRGAAAPVDDVVGPESPCPAETAEDRGILDEELNRLPRGYRLAVILHHLDGQSVEAAARQLGWNEGKYRGALFRGRQLLRKRLEKRGLGAGLSVAGAAPAAVVGGEMVARTVDAAGQALENAGPANGGGQRDMLILKWLMVFLTASSIGTGVLVARFRLAEPAPQNAVPAQPSVAADDLVRVPALRDGVLVEVLAKVGSKVKKGDVLARLDTRLAVLERDIKIAKLASARADLEASEKTREEAKKRYETAQNLAARGALSQEELRGSWTDRPALQSEVASRKEGVTVAELESKQAALLLELYEVRAPGDGVVKKVVRRKGEAVKALETVILLEAAE